MTEREAATAISSLAQETSSLLQRSAGTEAGRYRFPHHKLSLTKPDGRALHLYSRRPLDPTLTAPSPATSGERRPNAHLRWHPLRGEWVGYATHRQNRTFLPPKEFNPLAPTTDPSQPTEVPAGDWDVAVFENLFPALTLAAHDPPQTAVPTRPGDGVCEVVVFTQDAAASLGALPLDHLELLLAVWADRTAELGAHDEIRYVFPFENRGVEIGVTLQHPHGQIYAYPVVPPVPARELALQRAHFEEHGRSLVADLVADEERDGTRLVHRGDAALAWVPVCARYPYETWIAPRRAVPSLLDLEAAERRDVARALAVALRKLDALWSRPMPYLLFVHQAPTDGLPHPEAHVHIEICPYMRMPGRLKYLAGSETGAGFFTADSTPEDKAAELQRVKVEVP